jgi:hypothetical protein
MRLWIHGNPCGSFQGLRGFLIPISLGWRNELDALFIICSRWKHGWLLLRMALVVVKKLKFV